MQAHLWVYSVLMKLGPCLVLTVLTCWLVRRLWEAERHRQCMQNRFAPSFSADSRVGSEKKKSKKSAETAAASVQVTVCIFMIRFCFSASFTRLNDASLCHANAHKGSLVNWQIGGYQFQLIITQRSDVLCNKVAKIASLFLFLEHPIECL
jgi:hypothetical protein